MLVQGQSTRAKYVVMMNDHVDGFPIPAVCEIAKFHCKGDAIAYAIWRAHTIPEGKTHIFEVFCGSKKQYRAG